MQPQQQQQRPTSSIEMVETYYSRNPTPTDMQHYIPQPLPPGFNPHQLYRMEGRTSFSSVPIPEQVITQQPTTSDGSQVSTRVPSQFGSQPQMHQMPPMTSPHVGIPMPGLECLDGVPGFNIHALGILEGHTTCSPGYKIHNLQGELMLTGTSDTLFCPFDSKQKNIYVSDSNRDCIFQVKFTPSVCECDSEEKRCFAVLSPCFDNPFGAIFFESGQLKHSMKILNALEGETFAVQFLGSQDVSIKGAEGSIVAIINIHTKRGKGQRYSLTFMEELSPANKALFISCAITLGLVTCESLCTKCICLVPIMLGVMTIIGLSIDTVAVSGDGPKIKDKP